MSLASAPPTAEPVSMHILLIVILGLFVGILVGLTGIGGGSVVVPAWWISGPGFSARPAFSWAAISEGTLPFDCPRERSKRYLDCS